MTTIYGNKITAFVQCVREVMSAPEYLPLAEALDFARQMSTDHDYDSATLADAEATCTRLYASKSGVAK